MKYNEKEIQALIECLVNSQDQFILYGLYKGIKGHNYSDLLNIKVSDVANDYSYININGKTFICDEFMKDILIGVTVHGEYYHGGNNYYIDSSDDSESFCFNMDSKYLIKTFPNDTNNNGLNPMSVSELEKKLDTIRELYKSQGL